MATYTRNNAWNSGGTFDNQDLCWYAKGVGVMQSRTLDDPTSWWFFAAIHGQEIALTQFPGWGYLSAPPQVPTTPLPSPSLQSLYWDQCQHGSWYFAPWHRGYLIALEQQIRAAVVSLGGPSDWALPYWNYLGPGNENQIPPAFTQQMLPDGTQNPLLVTARYGPNYDGNIYVTSDATGACQNDTVYTGSYGGPQTLFSHSGGNFGDLEKNPHNIVHMEVGGYQDEQHYGLMSDPGLAALDPIFYLHHANIDRMWAAWNGNANSNPISPIWLKGPASLGGRSFAMPVPDGSSWSSWVYTPADVNSLTLLDYTYDNLTVPVPLQAANKLAQRLLKLGAAPALARTAQGENMDSGENAELLGAHDGVLQITSSGARATVKLDPKVLGRVSESLAAVSDANTPDHANTPDQVYLRLENVRGTIDAFKLYVSVNQQKLEPVALFGLRRASLKDREHGGQGLTYEFDITDIIDNLFLNNTLDADALDVKIEPNHAVPASAELTVGRVSVYRQEHQ